MTTKTHRDDELVEHMLADHDGPDAAELATMSHEELVAEHTAEQEFTPCERTFQ